ncbi:hypothetical protein IP92_04953 [Pseudoduganella flava]|uniref:Uncharacterized protein n=1 Tax=Pseudoduganella flava TaxID=871742 RepID=A0A562PG47_9BURK|nr:hypothetical protein IP92_04953 [Pseudoduganella flava]
MAWRGSPSEAGRSRVEAGGSAGGTRRSLVVRAAPNRQAATSFRFAAPGSIFSTLPVDAVYVFDAIVLT